MTAASAALGAPATAATARLIALLAITIAASNAVLVGGSMAGHGRFGGLSRAPVIGSVAAQSTTAGAAAPTRISTLRASVKSLRLAVAAALPTAEVTGTGL